MQAHWRICVHVGNQLNCDSSFYLFFLLQFFTFFPLFAQPICRSNRDLKIAGTPAKKHSTQSLSCSVIQSVIQSVSQSVKQQAGKRIYHAESCKLTWLHILPTGCMQLATWATLASAAQHRRACNTYQQTKLKANRNQSQRLPPHTQHTANNKMAKKGHINVAQRRRCIGILNTAKAHNQNA